jgi:FkbM family methyltransferase
MSDEAATKAREGDSALPGVLEQLALLARLRDRYGITLDYESILEADYRRFLGPGGVVADVGAHLGRHTRALASIVGREGLVLAFEPLPAEFAALQQLAAELPQVRPRRLALADGAGRREFVHAAGTPSESGLRQRAFNAPGEARPTTIVVEVSTLDRCCASLPRLDYVKMDIEGGEIDCLAGARETLARLRPIVSVEYGAAGYSAYGHERGTLFSLAASLGYSVVDLLGNPIDSLELWERACDNVYWDYLLVPRERRDETLRALWTR